MTIHAGEAEKSTTLQRTEKEFAHPYQTTVNKSNKCLTGKRPRNYGVHNQTKEINQVKHDINYGEKTNSTHMQKFTLLIIVAPTTLRTKAQLHGGKWDFYSKLKQGGESRT